MAQAYRNRKYLWGKHLLVDSLVAVSLAILLGVVGQPTRALDNNFADGITVDSKIDSSDASIGDNICEDGAGNCTLRAAIEESNATAGVQSIFFNISGPADFINGGQNGYTIQPTSGFPVISDSVIIDGYSQPGAQANTAIAPNPLNGTLLIEVNGENAGGDGSFGHPSNIIGLSFVSGSQLSTVSGLVINRFTGPGITIGSGVDDFRLSGNYIGTDPTGLINNGNNGIGVTILGTSSTSGGPENGKIGGNLPSERNIISGNDSTTSDVNLVQGSQGISITSESKGWEIKGNYIGIGADGVSIIPNELGGITVDFVRDLTIGGPIPGDANVFSGNGDGGIQPDGSDNIVIQGNFIGTDYTGTVSLPNQRKGISFVGSSNSIIGGVNPGEGNVIANAGNSDPGIFLNSGNSILGLIGPAQNISILGNRIFNNSGIGIDLNFNGVTFNDPFDPDTGSNNLLNYPQYSQITEASGDSIVTYHLDAPAGDYRIEFFSNSVADPSGNGEGETFLGFQNITHPGGGSVNFSHTLTGVTGVTNLAMTTTERNMPTVSTFGATSEFGSYVLPSSDLALTHTFLNPQSVAPGATLSYQIAIKNNGPDAFDLSKFTMAAPGTSNMVTLVMPPDITFAGNNSNPNVSCTSLGPGSAVIFGSSLGSHSDHEIVLCWWSGPSQLLNVGSTFSFNYDVTVQPTSDLVFTNYALIPPSPSSDPDQASIGVIYSSGQDVLDLLSQTTINNFASARYPIPVVISSQSVSALVSSLANTGTYILPMIVIGVLLITLSIATYIWNRLSHKKVDKTS